MKGLGKRKGKRKGIGNVERIRRSRKELVPQKSIETAGEIGTTERKKNIV